MMTASFGADFRNFNEAVRNADLKLKGFEENATKVERLLNKMGDRFDGTRVIQEAIAMDEAISKLGGTATLTARELASAGAQMAEAIEKMEKTGKGAAVTQSMRDLAKEGKAASEQMAGPQGVVGGIGTVVKALGPLGAAITGAFSVSAVVDFAKEIGSFAGQMVDLSDQTGISIEQLQALDYVAAGAGLTINDVTGAIGQMSNRLAGGDKSAAAAAEKLGLSIGGLLSQKPDAAFLQIAEAISKIENPMERTALAMDLFGRSGASMTRLMTGELEELVDQAKTTSAVLEEDLIRKADDFDDAWDQAVKKVKGYLAGLVLGPSFDEAEKRFDLLRRAQTDPRAAKESGVLNPDAREAEMLMLLDIINARRGDEVLARARATVNADARYPTAPIAPPLTRDQIFAMSGTLDPKVFAERERQEKEAERLEEQRRERIRQQYSAKPPSIEEMERAAFGMTIREYEAMNAGFKALIAREHADFARLRAGAPFIPGAGDVPRPDPQFDDAQGVRMPPEMLLGGVGSHMTEDKLRGYSDAGTTASKVFGRSLQANLGPNIMAAIMGGGSITKTIGSTFGDAIFGGEKGFGASIAKSLSGSMGAFGKGLASMVPMIGPLLGPAIEGVTKLVGKLFGGEVKKANRLRDQAVAAAGGIDALAEKARQAGTDVKALLGAKSEDQVKKAVEDLNAAFEKQQAILDKYGVTWRDYEGSARGAKLAEEAKTIGGEFDALTRSGLTASAAARKVKDSVVELSIAAVEAGEGIPAAMQPIIVQLAQMGELTNSQVQALLGLANSASVDFARMEEMAKKYGIELAALGQGFQNAKIGAAADEIIADFQFLVDAGADVNGVIAGMADELQNVVTQALEFGVALPEAMKPVLQRMADQGQLTDAAGNKLTDLSGINFAPPIEESINRLIESMTALIDKIGGVGGALSSLPAVNVPVNYVSGGPTQPDWSAVPMEGYATGTKGKYLDFGAGTPVVLHGKERVMTEGEGEGGGDQTGAMLALVSSVNSLQLVMLRAIKENALTMRDQTLIALGRA